MDESATGRRGYRLAFWCAVVSLLIGLYFGSYFCLVSRIRPPGSTIVPGMRIPHVPLYSNTRSPIDNLLIFAFRPAHWIDRRLRPNYWSPILLVGPLRH